jgi:glyoxylase I family protein
MEKVLGIGGFFWRSRDPNALAAWYEQHLGINGPGEDYSAMPWVQEGGICVFVPFSETTEMFGRPEQQWMINFRVRDMQAMVAQLTAAGIAVEVDPEHYPNGWFAPGCHKPIASGEAKPHSTFADYRIEATPRPRRML